MNTRPIWAGVLKQLYRILQGRHALQVSARLFCVLLVHGPLCKLQNQRIGCGDVCYVFFDLQYLLGAIGRIDAEVYPGDEGAKIGSQEDNRAGHLFGRCQAVGYAGLIEQSFFTAGHFLKLILHAGSGGTGHYVVDADTEFAESQCLLRRILGHAAYGKDIEEYLQEVFVEISRRHKFTAENMVAETGSIFAKLYEHRAALSVLSKAGQLDLVDRFLYQETLDQILRLNVLNNKYQPYFFAGATSALIKAWIAFGFEESPEEMTDIFFHSLAGYMDIPNQ